MQTREHVTVIAALRIAFGLLGLLAAAIVLVAIVGGGLISGDQDAIRITGIVGTAIATFIGLLSLPSLVAGFGLLKHWSWARWLTLALSVLDLMLIPLGTLFGIYAIWALMQDEVGELFAGACC